MTTNGNNMAFPGAEDTSPGLSKREWLAGMALAGLLQGRAIDMPESLPRRVALASLRIADALLEELERSEP